MYYFGWRRSDVQAREMSIDVSLFGFSTQDYVLRSVSSLYLPLLVIFGLCLAWVAAHARLVRMLPTGGGGLSPPAGARDVGGTHRRRGDDSRRLLPGVRLAGRPHLAAVAGGLARQPAGVPAVGGAPRTGDVDARRGVRTVDTPPAAPASRQAAAPLWRALLPVVLVASTVALGGFWMLEEYAAAVGRGAASTLVANVDGLAHAVVVSPTPLGIVAPGVQEERIGAPDSPTVRYRTTGLRLLARSGGKVLLLHDGWTPADGTVIVLADSDDLVWQFSR